MNRRSVLRTVFITAIFALLMSAHVFANTWGAQLTAKKSWSYINVNATDNTMLHKLVVPEDAMVGFSGMEVYVSSYSGSISTYGMSFSLLKTNYVPINYYGGSTTYVDATNPNSSSYIKLFALKKGVYYIRVTNLDKYRLMVKYIPMKDQGGLTKKKATNLGRKKSMSTLFGAAETYSKTEWFKIKVTKPRKITLTVAAEGEAGYDIYLYGPKPYKKGVWITSLYGGNSKTIKIGTGYYGSSKMKKLKKGKYYLKIVRKNYKTSGYCKVYWK